MKVKRGFYLVSYRTNTVTGYFELTLLKHDSVEAFMQAIKEGISDDTGSEEFIITAVSKIA